MEVKQSAEDRETNSVHKKLADTVFAGDCSNWYIGEFGRNAASWPGLARSFWWKTYFPDWSAFNLVGGSRWWRLHMLKRWIVVSSTAIRLALIASVLSVSYFLNLVHIMDARVNAR
jgi:hypothetical protein